MPRTAGEAKRGQKVDQRRGGTAKKSGPSARVMGGAAREKSKSTGARARAKSMPQNLELMPRPGGSGGDARVEKNKKQDMDERLLHFGPLVV